MSQDAYPRIRTYAGELPEHDNTGNIISKASGAYIMYNTKVSSNYAGNYIMQIRAYVGRASRRLL